MSFKNYRVESKSQWGVNLTASENLTQEQVQLGAILSIADASELMAKNFIALQNDRDMYKSWYDEQKSYKEKRDKTISSLRGQITKLKKKLNGMPTMSNNNL